MDQLATVLEIMQDVRSLDTNQKMSVMEYVKKMTLQKNHSEESYRKKAIREIRSAFNSNGTF